MFYFEISLKWIAIKIISNLSDDLFVYIIYQEMSVKFENTQGTEKGMKSEKFHVLIFADGLCKIDFGCVINSDLKNEKFRQNN